MAKTTRLKTLYEGKHIKLVQRGTYEFASRKKTSGIVAIVAVNQKGKLILIEQFRPPVNARVIEIPAGLAGDIEGHELEELADAAKRELLEETGYVAREMKPVAEGPPSAGICDEVITIFVARGLKKTGDAAGDGSEDITVHEVAVSRVAAFLKRKVKEGCLVDLKVYAAMSFL